MNGPIIGVAATGSRSGKDTVCDYLVKTRDYVKIRFSDPIVDECLKFYGTVLQAYINETMPISPLTPRELLTDHRTPVTLALLQDQGTMRRAQDPEYWTKRVAARILEIQTSGRQVAVSGVRYVNEVELIQKWGGVAVKVVRPLGPRDWVTDLNRAHAVEHGLDGYDGFNMVFTNDGTVADLEEKVGRWMRRFDHE
jgi:hypothetical protein